MTPSRFRQELQRFDKQLDFVFNGRKSRWEIIGHDLKHKRYLIASFKLGEMETLGTQFIRDMAEVSPVRQSAREVNKRIDRILEDEEKSEEKQYRDSLDNRLEEAWDRFQYAEGSRVSFHVVGSEEKKIVIRDRRRFVDVAATKEETNVDQK